MSAPGRTVHAFVSHGGRWLGELPAFDVESPWWPDVEPVNRCLSEQLGVETSVVRLIGATGTAPRDGEVSYHVELVDDPPRPQPWKTLPGPEGDAILAPHPRRRAWAVPGGALADIAWADELLDARGTPRIQPVVQVKTWNLSCVHRLTTADGNVWLKTTGPEQTREELPIAAVGRVEPSLVPKVVGADARHCRILCEEIAGRDLVHASLDVVLATTERWVAAQAKVAASTPSMRSAGIRVELLDEIAPRIQRLLDGPWTGTLSHAERSSVATVIQQLPSRVRQLAATGLPQTLLHGDFTPINWRGDERGAVLYDWADSYVGHPANDLLALLGRLPDPWHSDVVDTWCRSWERYGPPGDPAAAASAARSLVPLRAALLYAGFLDAIEPSEWPYHEDDPVAQLRRALDVWDEA